VNAGGDITHRITWNNMLTCHSAKNSRHKTLTTNLNNVQFIVVLIIDIQFNYDAYKSQLPDMDVCVFAPPSSSCVTSSLVTACTSHQPIIIKQSGSLQIPTNSVKVCSDLFSMTVNSRKLQADNSHRVWNTAAVTLTTSGPVINRYDVSYKQQTIHDISTATIAHCTHTRTHT